MAYYIDFAPAAERAFLRLSPDIQKRLVPRIDALAEDPRPHNARMLQGEKDTYRLRVGDYRIVYRVEDEAEYVYVTLIGHRSNVYRNL